MENEDPSWSPAIKHFWDGAGSWDAQQAPQPVQGSGSQEGTGTVPLTPQFISSVLSLLEGETCEQRVCVREKLD